MLSTLMLSALVLVHPANPPAAAVQADPAIRIWLSNDGHYQRGDAAGVQVQSRNDGYLLVLHVDPDGHLRVLFPLDPNDNAHISGGRKYDITGRDGHEAFTVANRSGQGTVYAAISQDPFKLEGYVAGGHWDYSALDNVRISEKPEKDLNEFVERLARSDFDYDLLNYTVYENVVYGQGTTNVYNYGPMGYGYPGYYGGYGYGYGGSSLFISFGFPFYYSPFYYRPFYYPYYPAFYYPYPRYYYPAVYYPAVYYPGYHYPVVNPYFPWRQRTTVATPSPYFPWRARAANQAYNATAFQWRAREVASRTPTNGMLAASYRGRFADVTPVARAARSSTTPVSTASTPMRTREPAGVSPSPRRSLDMTPGRTEQTRRPGTVLSDEPQRAPVGRRAVDRPGNASSQPQRVNPGAGNAARMEVADRSGSMPDRVPQARPSNPQVGDPNLGEQAQVIRGEDRSGYEGVRVIPSRAPEARRAEDDRPASRPNVERGQMNSPGGRIDRGGDPAPARGQSGDNSPGSRGGSSESRPQPSGRGGGDGWSGGGRGGWGGGAPAARGDGGGSPGGGVRGGAGMGGGGMSMPSRHR
ncbi:MAG TPA: DUF4384 domain-containing protein [Gemmatimonadales bacterium]|jgi:hypothetical protein|nr:DUF4384 domain-containing protein [Gemmatimonadales bacterium]